MKKLVSSKVSPLVHPPWATSRHPPMDQLVNELSATGQGADSKAQSPPKKAGRMLLEGNWAEYGRTYLALFLRLQIGVFLQFFWCFPFRQPRSSFRLPRSRAWPTRDAVRRPRRRRRARKPRPPTPPPARAAAAAPPPGCSAQPARGPPRPDSARSPSAPSPESTESGSARLGIGRRNLCFS